MTFASQAERDAFEAGVAEGVRQMLDCAATVASVEPGALLHNNNPPTLAGTALNIAGIDAIRLAVLRPFDAAEAVPLKTAAALAGRHRNTILEWVERYGIGRTVGGRIMVSLPALRMYLAGDAFALVMFLCGLRHHEAVRPYLQRAGLA